MDRAVDSIAREYVAQNGEAVSSRGRLRDLYHTYVRRRESTLLDAAAATAAVDVIFFAD